MHEYYVNELSLKTRSNLAYFLNTPLGILFVQAVGLNKGKGKWRRDTALIKATIDDLPIVAIFLGKFADTKSLWYPPKVENIVTWEAGQTFDLPLEINCPKGYNVLGTPILPERVQKICARSYNLPLLGEAFSKNSATLFWWWRTQRLSQESVEVTELCRCERKCPFALYHKIDFWRYKLPSGYVPEEVEALFDEEVEKEE